MVTGIVRTTLRMTTLNFEPARMAVTVASGSDAHFW